MRKPQNHKQLKTNTLKNGQAAFFKNSSKSVTKRNKTEPGDTIPPILKIMKILIQTKKTPKNDLPRRGGDTKQLRHRREGGGGKQKATLPGSLLYIKLTYNLSLTTYD